MPYTSEEGGRLNNFAREPKIYQAEPLTKTEQEKYILWGMADRALVGSILFLAFLVSSVSWQYFSSCRTRFHTI